MAQLTTTLAALAQQIEELRAELADTCCRQERREITRELATATARLETLKGQP